MAISRVDLAAAWGTSSNAPAQTGPPAGNIPASSLLVALVVGRGSASTPLVTGVSDTLGLTWQRERRAVDAATRLCIEVWTAPNPNAIASGGITVTATLTGSSNAALFVRALTGSTGTGLSGIVASRMRPVNAGEETAASGAVAAPAVSGRVTGGRLIAVTVYNGNASAYAGAGGDWGNGQALTATFISAFMEDAAPSVAGNPGAWTPGQTTSTAPHLTMVLAFDWPRRSSVS